jgi:hypothetical protein
MDQEAPAEAPAESPTVAASPTGAEGAGAAEGESSEAHLTLNEAIAAHTSSYVADQLSDEQLMESLGFAGQPNIYSPRPAEPEEPAADPEYAAAMAWGGEPGSSAYGASEGSLSSWQGYAGLSSKALPGVQWAEDVGWFYGLPKSICMGAWCLFLTVPAIFFLLALPPLQARVHADVTSGGLAVFGLAGLCFFLTGCANPGVPPRPAPKDPAHPDDLPHPGHEYTLSRDTSRYVRGFDHFCEFVGNDIGKGNIPCFVAFLLCLSVLATYVVIASGWEQLLLWTAPAPAYHLLPDWWRLGLAGLVIALVLWGLHACWTSDACAGVGPLILLMPGAHGGAVLVLLVTVATILLPLVSDMWADVSPAHNPAGFFLVLPCLVFAVLFWGMSLHWVWLLGEGLSQKLWLRAKGYKKPRKPTAADGTALV